MRWRTPSSTSYISRTLPSNVVNSTTQITNLISGVKESGSLTSRSSTWKRGGRSAYIDFHTRMGNQFLVVRFQVSKYTKMVTSRKENRPPMCNGKSQLQVKDSPSQRNQVEKTKQTYLIGWWHQTSTFDLDGKLSKTQQNPPQKFNPSYCNQYHAFPQTSLCC